MEARAKASGGASGAIAFNVCSTTPSETLNRVVKAAEGVTQRALTSAGNRSTSVSVSAESSGGAAGIFAAVNIYDPTSQTTQGV
jgi:hypothetical protein